MNATQQRDSVSRIAKTDTNRALEIARSIPAPWFRAQSFAHVARYCRQDPTRIADEAAAAALKCPDAYQRCAVRAWEIAALAERSDSKSAFSRLSAVLSSINDVTPHASRSEALMLLLSAATRIDSKSAENVSKIIVHLGTSNSHWRCHRAVVDAVGILSQINPQLTSRLSNSLSDQKLKAKCDRIIALGGSSPRSFFW